MRLVKASALGVVAAFALLACAAAPAPEPPAGGRAEQAGFVLQVTLPRLSWTSTEAIEVTTILTYAGLEPEASIWSAAGGPVVFALSEVGGRRQMGGAQDAVCAKHSYARGIVAPIPFAKSGGWSGDDPNAAFYRAFFKDPVLHLPPGRWSMIVTANGFLAPCEQAAPRLELHVPAILIDVR